MQPKSTKSTLKYTSNFSYAKRLHRNFTKLPAVPAIKKGLRILELKKVRPIQQHHQKRKLRGRYILLMEEILHHLRCAKPCK